MGKIYVLGLGPGDVGSLTLKVVERLNSGDKNYLRTEKHPIIDYIKGKNISYETYDYVYEKKDKFEDIYEFIAKDLIEKSKEFNIINYFVPGNPIVAEKSVEILLEMEKQKRVELEIIPGMSFIDPILIAVNRDPIDGLKLINGINLKPYYVDINTDMIITQVYNSRIASEVKIILSEIYGDEFEIYVINAAGIEGKEKIFKIPIYGLDRIKEISYLTSIYIPKVDKINKKLYDFNDLLSLVERLRGEDGCPWDREQTHLSIRECAIEEAYEVVDAIDQGDIDNLVEELGDLILQVIFHSQIGSEDGNFNIWDVTTKICNKLIDRHPHVFEEKKVENSEEVVYNWNDIKFKAQNIVSYTERLKSIPPLPSLMRSYKVQERAKEVGFDWNNVDGAVSKIKEEYLEVLEILNNFKGGDIDRLEEELGDLLFSVVNVCRFFNINPEVILNKSINKFINRFEEMENLSNQRNKDLKEMTLEEMDELWNLSKIHKNKRFDKN